MNKRALHAHKKTSALLGLCRRDSMIASMPLAAMKLGRKRKKGGENVSDCGYSTPSSTRVVAVVVLLHPL